MINTLFELYIHVVGFEFFTFTLNVVNPNVCLRERKKKKSELRIF